MELKILSCPFCGKPAGEGLIVTRSIETHTGSFAVKCLGCGAWGPYGASNKDLAVEFWNRREGLAIIPVTVTDTEGQQAIGNVSFIETL